LIECVTFLMLVGLARNYDSVCLELEYYLVLFFTIVAVFLGVFIVINICIPTLLLGPEA